MVMNVVLSFFDRPRAVFFGAPGTGALLEVQVLP